MSEHINQPTPKVRMRTADAAAYLGVSTSYLEKRRMSGDGPAYLKIGHAVVYEVATLDAWVAQHQRTNTAS